MPRGGRRSTSWKPGKPGGPGRPRKNPEEKASAIAKKAIADVKAAAKEWTEQAISTLAAALMQPGVPWAAKIQASNTLLDRGWGKPEQTTNLNVNTLENLSDADLAAFIAGAKQSLEHARGDLEGPSGGGSDPSSEDPPQSIH